MSAGTKEPGEPGATGLPGRSGLRWTTKLIRTVAVSLLALSLLVLGGCGSGEAASDSPAPDWLFSLQATSTSSFDPVSGMLVMPVDTVLWFTDRPDRLSAFSSPESFVELWSDEDPDSFTDDPPNMVITWWPANGGYSKSMEVASIAGDVSYDPAGKALSMSLAPDGSAGLELPTSMEQVSVFVDGWSTQCPSGAPTAYGPNGNSTPICINDQPF